MKKSRETNGREEALNLKKGPLDTQRQHTGSSHDGIKKVEQPSKQPKPQSKRSRPKQTEINKH
jgi:hypothetical protein